MPKVVSLGCIVKLPAPGFPPASGSGDGMNSGDWALLGRWLSINMSSRSAPCNLNWLPSLIASDHLLEDCALPAPPDPDDCDSALAPPDTPWAAGREVVVAAPSTRPAAAAEGTRLASPAAVEGFVRLACATSPGMSMRALSSASACMIARF